MVASFNSGDTMRLPPIGMSLRWFERFLANESFTGALVMSLRVALITTILATALATCAAVCQRALSGRIAPYFQVAVTLPLLFPELLTAIGLLFFLHQLGLGKTVVGLQIGHTVMALPFAFIVINASFSQLSRSLEDASTSLGASEITTFRRIVLPIVAPGILMGALFSFIVSFDIFTISLLLKPLGGNTLPLALFEFLTYEFDPTAAAAATLSIICSLIVVAAIQRLTGLWHPT